MVLESLRSLQKNEVRMRAPSPIISTGTDAFLLGLGLPL